MHAHDIHVLPSPPGYQGIATVLERQAEGWLVEGGRARFWAKRAASCLLEPIPGDRVWVVSQTEHFVIAVLERQAGVASKLTIEGDVELHAGGRMQIAADQGLELASERELSLSGDELQVEARTGRVLLDRCAMVLGSLHAHLRETTIVGKLLSTLVERVTQRSKQSVRAIEQLDHVQAGCIDYRAEQTVHVHAKHAMVRAEQLVKMDADQIHLG